MLYKNKLKQDEKYLKCYGKHSSCEKKQKCKYFKSCMYYSEDVYKELPLSITSSSQYTSELDGYYENSLELYDALPGGDEIDFFFDEDNIDEDLFDLTLLTDCEFTYENAVKYGYTKRQLINKCKKLGVDPITIKIINLCLQGDFNYTTYRDMGDKINEKGCSIYYRLCLSQKKYPWLNVFFKTFFKRFRT